MKEKEEKQKEKEKQKVPASPVARSQVSPSPRNSSRVKQAEPFRAIGKTELMLVQKQWRSRIR